MVAAKQFTTFGSVHTTLTSVAGAVEVRRRHRVLAGVSGRHELLSGDLGPTGVAMLILLRRVDGKLPEVPAVVGTDVPGKYPEDVRGMDVVRRDEVPIASAIEPHRACPTPIKPHNHGARRKFDDFVCSGDVLLQAKLVSRPVSTKIGVTTPVPVAVAIGLEASEEDLPPNAGVAAVEQVLNSTELRLGPVLGDEVGGRDSSVKTLIGDMAALGP